MDQRRDEAKRDDKEDVASDEKTKEPLNAYLDELEEPARFEEERVDLEKDFEDLVRKYAELEKEHAELVKRGAEQDKEIARLERMKADLERKLFLKKRQHPRR